MTNKFKRYSSWFLLSLSFLSAISFFNSCKKTTALPATAVSFNGTTYNGNVILCDTFDIPGDPYETSFIGSAANGDTIVLIIYNPSKSGTVVFDSSGYFSCDTCTKAAIELIINHNLFGYYSRTGNVTFNGSNTTIDGTFTEYNYHYYIDSIRPAAPFLSAEFSATLTCH